MPIVSLKMGASLNPDYIKEGDSVYFECNTTANPKPYKMTWYHNVSTTFSRRRGVRNSDNLLRGVGITAVEHASASHDNGFTYGDEANALAHCVHPLPDIVHAYWMCATAMRFCMQTLRPLPAASTLYTSCTFIRSAVEALVRQPLSKQPPLSAPNRRVARYVGQSPQPARHHCANTIRARAR